jgi:hypothetical protein
VRSTMTWTSGFWQKTQSSSCSFRASLFDVTESAWTSQTAVWIRLDQSHTLSPQFPTPDTSILPSAQVCAWWWRWLGSQTVTCDPHDPDTRTSPPPMIQSGTHNTMVTCGLVGQRRNQYHGYQ